VTDQPDALDALYKAAVVRGDDVEAAKLEAALDTLRAPARIIGTMDGAALWYAHHGWPVFPLRVWSKLPAIPSPHPVGSRERAECKGECGSWGHGLHDATTKTGIAQTMGFETGRNIGIATGHLMDVIDIDPAGHAELAAQLAANPHLIAMTILGIAVTPRLGYHLWVPPTGRSNTADLLPGIDYRGIGGYVVAPPSFIDDKRHNIRGPYRWLMPPIKAEG
jgi:hypothetical protein